MMVLVTGASGFVGQALCDELRSRGLSVRPALRQIPDRAVLSPESNIVAVGPISVSADWRAALNGCDVVIHLAGRVHVMHDDANNPLAEFRKVNTEGTLNLARQAAQGGVRRFVFLSSIKVNGEETFPHIQATTQGGGRAMFTADDQPSPQDAYAISKWEAEKGLYDIAAQTGMEVVIVRPPLVYGPGVKANFASLMQVVARGFPLPFGAVTENRRSFIALDNLTDFLVICSQHPAAADQTFLVSDGVDLSTAELIRRLGEALGKPARLWRVPLGVLRIGAQMLKKRDVFQRLCGSLQVDSGKAYRLLGWKAPISVDEGLRRAVAGVARR